MSATPLLVVVGGFLGAGKTTVVLGAAKRLRRAGRRIAIITNDQGSDLVDTAAGQRVTEVVAEIAGGCFCCRFDALQETLRHLLQTYHPDIVLAEAVGSCTDLAATVYQPLRQIGTVAVHLAPLGVVVDGRRLCDLIRFRRLPRMPQTVTYLYDRQLAEADVLLLNKIDLLSAEERASVETHLASTYPGVPVVSLSAVSDHGLDTWLDYILAREHGEDTRDAGRRVLDLDYDRYADAEARLGWLNLEGTLGTSLLATDWIRTLLEAIGEQARAATSEVAHVKVWLESSEAVISGNLVAMDRSAVVTVQGRPATQQMHARINARVATDPDTLRSWIERALARANARAGSTFSVARVAAFSPARPTPAHRLQPPQC